MTLQRIAIIAVTTFVSFAAQAQLFRPLGLGEELCERKYSGCMPQLHVEDNILYVCTNQGLYCKDLSDDASQWHLAGFEGKLLQDYARNGDDILALRYNVDSCFLLLSHDGGKTFQDINPPGLIINSSQNPHKLIRLVQHPEDPNTLLALSNIWGLFKSTDFGQTWSKLAFYYTCGSNFGYHPARPDVIYQSGSDDTDEPLLYVSHDSGQTWDNVYPFCWAGGNSAYQVTFNPSFPDQWIFGADGELGISYDNGYTWEPCEMTHEARQCHWSKTAYDSEDSNIVYTFGSGKLMCSTDGGKSWLPPLDIHLGVWDFDQYGDKLLIYGTTDVYEASKAELLAQSNSSVQRVVPDGAEGPAKVYDLQGRPTDAPSTGIYIKNGRKVILTR